MSPKRLAAKSGEREEEHRSADGRRRGVGRPKRGAARFTAKQWVNPAIDWAFDQNGQLTPAAPAGLSLY